MPEEAAACLAAFSKTSTSKGPVEMVAGDVFESVVDGDPIATRFPLLLRSISGM